MTTTQLTTIELAEKQFCFAIAHFTIFSATARERLHGHNYRVKALITSQVTELGISFDYDIFVDKLRGLCQQLDRYLLLPEHSPVLKITSEDAYYQVEFNHEKMSFLKSDTLLLPLRNITIEELSKWFLSQLLNDPSGSIPPHIQEFTIKVSNGDGRWGASRWYQTKQDRIAAGK